MDEWGTGHLSEALPGLSHDSPAHPVLPPPQFVLENSSREDKHECPFARSSIQLTVLLCDLLHVGEPCEWCWAQRVQEQGTEGQRGPGAAHTISLSPSCPPAPGSETAQDFSPMFFGQDQSFHELFCVSIQLLNKTWKEMRATQEDFDKVRRAAVGRPRPGQRFWGWGTELRP